MILEWIYIFIFTVGAITTSVAGILLIMYLVWWLSPTQIRERREGKIRNEMYRKARESGLSSRVHTRYVRTWDEFMKES
jgi:hypothetical protein